MSWLYGQTWLWYLLAFLVGVLLAWIVLVLPAQRTLRAQRGGTPATGGDRAAGGTAPPAADPGRPDRPAVDDAATEQLPAANPAMSTLDTFGTGAPAGGPAPRGAATAGLGAAGLGTAGSGAGGSGVADPGRSTRKSPTTPAGPEQGPDARD